MPHAPSSPTRSGATGGAVVLLAAILLLALSLRTGIGSLSVLLPTVRDAIGFSAGEVSLLTTLPPLCFAVVGLGTGRLVLRYGVHRVTVALLVAIVVGLLARAVTGSVAVFLLATVVAMAGVAVGNVVLPALTKLHFATRTATVSALYGATMVGGATLASSLTVPVSDLLGGWRWGLACWALVPALGVLLWLPRVRADRRPVASEPSSHSDRSTDGGKIDRSAWDDEDTGPRPIGLGAIARTRLGFAFLLCFAAQSAQAYVQFGWWGSMATEAGADDAHAGVLLGVITAVGIPVTLALPALIRLTGGGAALPVVFSVATVAGWLGVLVAPLALGGFAWALLLGLGSGAFTWTLAMLAQRTRTANGTSQLSALTQGVGYLGAAVATFVAGLLHDRSGDWDAAVVMMIVLGVLIGVAGTALTRGPALEDVLAAPRSLAGA